MSSFAPSPASGDSPFRSTVVKVCGITRLEDARTAVEAGADWLGFVVKADSPRTIDAAAAGEIALQVPTVVAVAVMVAPTPDQALRLATASGASRVQLHRVDPNGWPRDFPLPVCFALAVESDGRITSALPEGKHLLLLDTADTVLAGGTGRSFPWETARALAATRPTLLAGGLDGDIVAEALDLVRPYGVDASSRLESAPGIKDPVKMRRFVHAVRRWEREGPTGASLGANR